MKYSKDQYILRNLSKIRHKQWELFIISRIIHLLNDSDIEFVCQQPIRTMEGTRYLDLCFPNLNVYLEIDELHHSKNVISDKNRMREIIDVTDFSENRIRIYDNNNNDRALNDITDEVDEFISFIKTTKERLLSKGKFTPWHYENKFSSEVHISRGYLDVKDNVSFLTHREALRCFGYLGGDWQKAVWPIPNTDKHVWFPKLYPNDFWINSLSDDFKTITMIPHQNSEKASKITEDIYKKLIISEYKDEKAIIFGFYKDVLGQTIYKFIGEFHASVDESDARKIVSKRKNTRIELKEFC